MLRNFFIIFGLFFLLVPTVLAIDTEIKIKTIPDYEVQATTYDPSSVSFNAFERFKEISDEYGDVKFTFTSNEPSFNLIVYIKKDGATLMGPKKFLDNVAGETIDLRLAPDSFTFIETPVNNTNVSETNTTNNDTLENDTLVMEEETVTEEDSAAEESKGATGLAVSENNSTVFSNQFLYYIIGVLALVAIVFATYKVAQVRLIKSGAIKSGNKRKLDDLQKEKKEKMTEYKKVIEDAEKKIKEAQAEIKKLKNEDKIKEMKKKIEEDEKELIRLREGKD